MIQILMRQLKKDHSSVVTTVTQAAYYMTAMCYTLEVLDEDFYSCMDLGHGPMTGTVIFWSCLESGLAHSQCLQPRCPGHGISADLMSSLTPTGSAR